jgi:hypothetical protein
MVIESKLQELQLPDCLKWVNLKRKELSVCLSREIPQNHFKKDKITVLNIKIFG